MASSAVSEAVLDRVAAGWTYAPLVVLNSGTDAPAGNTPLLTVTFPVATETQITIGAPGANVFREEGAIRFVLSVPAKQVLDPYLVWMDQLRTLFRNQFFGGVQTWGAPPVTTDDRNDTGAYFNLSFAVPYRFDLIA